MNPRLCTHDLRNLSVLSASTFVTGAAANPTLALKCAEHIDEVLSG